HWPCIRELVRCWANKQPLSGLVAPTLSHTWLRVIACFGRSARMESARAPVTSLLSAVLVPCGNSKNTSIAGSSPFKLPGKQPPSPKPAGDRAGAYDGLSAFYPVDPALPDRAGTAGRPSTACCSAKHSAEHKL